MASKMATEPMTKKARVRAALRGEAVDRVPVAMWGHDYLREWTRESLVEATLELYRAHDWDLIKLNPRWTHFAEAWGSTYEPPSEQRNPRTLTTTIHSAEDLANLRPVHARRGVFSDHLSALELMLAEVGDEVDVVATVFSPLSVVGFRPTIEPSSTPARPGATSRARGIRRPGGRTSDSTTARGSAAPPASVTATEMTPRNSTTCGTTT